MVKLTEAGEKLMELLGEIKTDPGFYDLMQQHITARTQRMGNLQVS